MSVALMRDGKVLHCVEHKGVFERGVTTPMKFLRPLPGGSARKIYAHPFKLDAYYLLITTASPVGSTLLFINSDGISSDLLTTEKLVYDFVIRDEATAYVLTTDSVYEVSLQLPPPPPPASAASVDPAPVVPAAPPSLGLPVVKDHSILSAAQGLAWDARRHILWISSYKGAIVTWSPIPALPGGATPPARLVQRLYGSWPIQMAVHDDTGHLVMLTAGKNLDFMVVTRSGDVSPLVSETLEGNRAQLPFTGFAIVQGASCQAWRTHASLVDLSQRPPRPTSAPKHHDPAATWVLLCATQNSPLPGFSGAPAAVAPRAYPPPIFEAQVAKPTQTVWAAVSKELSRGVAASRITIRCRDGDGTSSDVSSHREVLMARIPYFRTRFGGSWAQGQTSSGGAAASTTTPEVTPAVAAVVAAAAAAAADTPTTAPDGAGRRGQKRKAGAGGAAADTMPAASGGGSCAPGSSPDAGALPHPPVVTVDASQAVVRCLLRWASNAKLDLTAANVVAVATLADMWGAAGASELCEEWLIDNLATADLPSFLLHATSLGLARLRVIAVEHVGAVWFDLSNSARAEMMEALGAASPALLVEVVNAVGTRQRR